MPVGTTEETATMKSASHSSMFGLFSRGHRTRRESAADDGTGRNDDLVVLAERPPSSNGGEGGGSGKGGASRDSDSVLIDLFAPADKFAGNDTFADEAKRDSPGRRDSHGDVGGDTLRGANRGSLDVCTVPRDEYAGGTAVKVVDPATGGDEPHRCRTAVADLQPGMYICELDRSWDSTPFSDAGLPLHDWDDVCAVRQHCDYVYVDSARYFEGEPPSATRDFSAAAEGAELYPLHPIDRGQLRRARHCYSQAKASVVRQFAAIADGQPVDGAAARETVAICARSVIDNPEPLCWLTRSPEIGDGLAQHAVNTCILSLAFARYLGLPRRQLEELGICALLHDIGLLRPPAAEFVLQRELLDRSQYCQLQEHVAVGCNLLMDASDIYHGAADVAWSHHESWDGTGYPRRLRGGQIPLFAQMVALADCYESVISPRRYQPPRSSLEALRLIHAKRGARFEPRLALRFIECIGVHPPGALVEMDSGEIGVVLGTTRDKQRPRLLLLRDAEGRKVAPQPVDLDAEARAGRDWPILQQLPVGSEDIDPRTYMDERWLMHGRRTLARPIDIVL